MRVLQYFFLMSVVMAAAVCGVRAADTESEEGAAEVGLFDAMDKGLVEVKMTQNGALEGNISVKNVSGQPLKIDMPAAFAGVPVAQPGGFGMGGPGMMGPGMMGGGNQMGMGGGMMPGGAMNNRPRQMGLGDDHGRTGMGTRSGTSGGNQSVGGGSRGGMGGRGGGRGAFFVAPEKTVREKVRTVCLEHGKNDPRGGQEYALVPIETVSENKTTKALCEMLGDDSIDQQALQAAVWNQECEVPMEELAAKVRQPAGNVTPTLWFSEEQMAGSQQLIAAAEVRAEELKAEEAAEQKAEDVKEEEAVLSNDNYNGTAPEIDTTIEKLTEELK